MILHASAAFVKRFKCEVSFADRRRPQDRTRTDSWSCHFVRLGTTPVVVVMQDATLYTLVIPSKGAKTFGDFWLRFLDRVGELWQDHGMEFDPKNQTIIVLPRTDRSRIGSMNDAILLFRYHRTADDTLADLEARSNETPYKAIGYESPKTFFSKMISR